MNEKQKALLSVARAYIERGSYIQYDQRSMDRVLELTPRCRKRLPPKRVTVNILIFWIVLHMLVRST